MSSQRRPISARIPHKRLLDLLGSKVRSHSLPQLTQCPICKKGMMQVYDDYVNEGGKWYWCRNCQSNGDLIELAAKTWQLELPHTIFQLAKHGFDIPRDKESIERYQREHVEYRERLNALWKRAQQGLIHNSHTLMRVSDRLRLHWMNSVERWNTGPGKLIGGLTKTDIETCFAPTVMRNAEKKRQKYNPSKSRVFRGAGWSDVLVVPFYDMPGRISCFLCVGRDGDPEQDFVIKRANRGSRGNQHNPIPFDAGLAFHPGLFDEAEYHDRTVIAIGDPEMALQLQFRNFDTSTRPLPVVTWLDTARFAGWQAGGRPTRTLHAWQMIGFRLVFWMPNPTFDVHTLRQAIKTNGMISTVGPREPGADRLREYCWKRTPHELCDHIREHGRQWEDVLSGELSKRSDSDVEMLLFELEQVGEDVDAILKRCHHPIRTRVAEMRFASEQPRSIEFNGQRIMEIDNEWHVQVRQGKRPELICDALLRLDAACMNGPAETLYYRGRIVHDDREVRFFEPMDVIDKNPLEWMKRRLLREGVGFLRFNPRWKNRIIPIAQTFHELIIDDEVSAVGWDGDTRRFVFPNFSVDVGGDVKPIDWPLFTKDAPGQELEAPEALSGEELGRPSAHRELEPLFWAVAGSVIANIIAPTVNEPTTGIGLAGSVVSEVGREVAKALGCVTVQVRSARDVQRAVHAQHTHGYPIVVELGYQLQRRHRRELLKLREEYRNMIVATDEITAAVMSLNRNWSVISRQNHQLIRRVVIPEDVSVLAKKLLPGYLKNLCDRHLEMVVADDGWETLAERTIRDLARFCDEFHGNPGGVLSALDVLVPDRDGCHPDVVAGLLDRLIRDQKLRVASKSDGRGKPRLVEVSQQDGLLLSREDFAKVLRDVPIEFPRWDCLNGDLFVSGALVEKRPDELLFRREWLQKRWKRAAAIETGLVKLHG